MVDRPKQRRLAKTKAKNPAPASAPRGQRRARGGSLGRHTVVAPWRDRLGNRTPWRMTSVPQPTRKAKGRAKAKRSRASRKGNR